MCCTLMPPPVFPEQSMSALTGGQALCLCTGEPLLEAIWASKCLVHYQSRSEQRPPRP